MGCTSSAPNSIVNANKEDKSIQFEDDTDDIEDTDQRRVAIDTDNERQTEIKVLPPSDTLAESVQLVRNNQSTTSLEPEKDLHTNGHIVETDKTNETATEEKEDKIAKLEEVVGKFIEITQQDINKDVEDSNTAESQLDSTENDHSEVDANIGVDFKENEDDAHSSEQNEEASPSQSQSSRATRWEALADIAAELPPSLAVDPITGQIYSLSK